MIFPALFIASLARFVCADDIVNLINPFWETAEGQDISGEFAASVVGVDATATTYAIGCKPNQSIPQTVSISANSVTVINESCTMAATDTGLTFTQGPTTMHWQAFSGTTGILNNSLSWTANYTFSRILDPTVTATESLSQILVGGVTNSYYDVNSSYAATWYPILITAGLNKLSVASATITPGPNPTSTVSPASTSTKSNAGSLTKVKWLMLSMAGGATILAL